WAARIALRRKRHRLDDDRRERHFKSRRQSQSDRGDAGQCDQGRRLHAHQTQSRLHAASSLRLLREYGTNENNGTNGSFFSTKSHYSVYSVIFVCSVFSSSASLEVTFSSRTCWASGQG